LNALRTVRRFSGIALLPSAFRQKTMVASGCALAIAASLPSQAASAPTPLPSASPPLYTPQVDALNRASTSSSTAAALEKRCKELLASGRPIAQMPAECKPYLPSPPSVANAQALFSYSPVIAAALLPRVPAPAPTPGASAADIERRCRAALATGVPPSQLPRECAPYVPPSGAANPPMCPDPAVATHVRMIPCPPAPSGSSSRVPPTATPPAQRAPTQPPSTTPPSTRPPVQPPAPNPGVSQRPPTPPTQPPETLLPPPPTPPAPVALPTPPVPIIRGAASQLPTGGGGAAVSPLSLPPPRTPQAAVASVVVAAPPAQDPQEFEAGEVVVFAPFAQSAVGALDVIAAAGGTVLLQENLSELEGLLLRVRANDGDATRLARVLREQLPQASVDLHARLFLFPLSGNGGAGGAPRHYARAMMQMSTTPTLLKREVRVGVIDSGVERVNALRGGIAGEKSFLPDAASPADSVHGTTVATLIAGQDEGAGFIGAAPGAKLYLARAMSTLPDGRNYTNSVSVLQALNWLLSEKVPIVNMSLGGKGDATLAIGIAQAIRKGLIVVAAAGNGGPGAAASFPAALPDVIAVTAVDVESKIYAQATRGDYVVVSAPGVDVWAPQRGGGSYVSGTSFASAWVSGALAIAASQSTAFERARVAQALCASSKDLGATGRDGEFGCGLLQVTDFAAKLR
jgi:Subtilase family